MIRHKLAILVWKHRVACSFHEWMCTEHFGLWMELESHLLSATHHFVVWNPDKERYFWHGGAPRLGRQPHSQGCREYVEWRRDA